MKDWHWWLIGGGVVYLAYRRFAKGGSQAATAVTGGASGATDPSDLLAV